MRTLRELPPSGYDTQELQGDYLEHPSDGKTKPESARPWAFFADIGVRQQRYSGDFQPGRDTAE